MRFKKIFLIIIPESLTVGLVFFLLVLHAHAAQVAVVGANGSAVPVGVGAVGSCYVNGTEGLPAVPVLVYPDGDDYAVTGNYSTSFDLNCNQYNGDAYSMCLAMKNAFTNATQIASEISGFPQAVNNGTVNNVVDVQSGSCGNSNGAGRTPPMCERTHSYPLPSGGYAVEATIIWDPSASGDGVNEFSSAQIENNPTLATCLVAHEMSHGFGVGDIYGATLTSGLMGNECAPTMSPNNEQTPGNPWDSATANAIRAVNDGSNVVVDPSSCKVTCSSGQSQRFQKNSSGYWVPFCSDSASPATDQYDCDCRGSDPTCTDLNTGVVGPPPAGRCQMPSLNLLTCTCNSDESGCVDESSTDKDIFTPPAGVCQSSKVPDGEVCSCFNGTASCEDANGNSITPPSDFSCQPVTTTYSCNSDNECVADATANPSDYTDSTCDNACGSSTSGPEYCAENPTDPNCAAYCTNNPTDPACVGSN